MTSDQTVLQIGIIKPGMALEQTAHDQIKWPMVPSTSIAPKLQIQNMPFRC